MDLDSQPFIVETVVDRLKRAWINERAAPELLPFATEDVTAVKKYIQTQQAVVHSEQDSGKSPEYLIDIYQLEIDRIHYILASYLRTRLKKLEKYAIVYCKPDSAEYKHLSPSEAKFVKGYVELLERHYGSVSDHIKNQLNGQVTGKRPVDKPDRNSFVFFRGKAEIQRVQVTEGNEVDVHPGDIFISLYSVFRVYLEDNQVELI